MRPVRALVPLVVALAVTACSNIKSTTITETNKDQVVAQVAQSNLPQEEKVLFAAYVTRVVAGQAFGGLAKVFGGDASKVPLPTIIGKTVAQVIEEERRLQAEQKAAEEKKARAEIERKKRIIAYLPQLLLSGIKTSRANSPFLGGDYAKVEGEIKNAGDQSLDRVVVTIYLRDKKGKPIHESTDVAVLVTDYSFGRDNSPLKPNYSRKLSAIVKDVPKDWAGTAEVKVTDLKFSDEKEEP